LFHRRSIAEIPPRPHVRRTSELWTEENQS
jgi:hypothetical protein